MTQNEIIRMAIDAGLGEYLHLDDWRFTPDGDDIKSLKRFFSLAFAAGAAYEREACAKLMDAMAAQDRVTNYYKVAANAIRARGQDGTD